MRNEGDSLLAALNELITIARSANIRAEVYHFKASGQQNWSKLDTAIAMIEAAQAEGLSVTTDMYNYPGQQHRFKKWYYPIGRKREDTKELWPGSTMKKPDKKCWKKFIFLPAHLQAYYW